MVVLKLVVSIGHSEVAACGPMERWPDDLIGSGGSRQLSSVANTLALAAGDRREVWPADVRIVLQLVTARRLSSSARPSVPAAADTLGVLLAVWLLVFSESPIDGVPT